MNIIKGIPPKGTVTSDSVVSVDIEIFGMVEPLHRPSGEFASMQIGIGDDVYVVLNRKDLQEAWDNIQPAKHIVIQNALFDIFHLRRWITVEERPVWDLMIVEQVLWGGYFGVGSFSLADMARRYLGVDMNKSVRDEFASASHMTEGMLQYAADDARITLEIYHAQVKEIESRESFSMRVYWEADEPSIWTVLDMKPIKVNAKRWIEMADEFAERGVAIEEELGLNVYSQKKVIAYIEKATGLKMQNTKANTLLAHVHKYPILDKILLARMYRKATSTYGKRWVDNFVEDDGFVYSSFRINGTETGRFSSCVVGDTVLDTSAGMYKIRDLDLHKSQECTILTHSGNVMPITDTWYRGKLPCYEITTSDGGRITCSFNHKLLTPRGWGEAHELNIGDRVSSSISKNDSERCGEEYGRDNFGNKISTITGMRYVGILDTYDITVEGDHSYVAGGFINHNSAPNLLQIPARRIPEYRELFVNSKGRMVVADISQQEPRCLAFLSNDAHLKQAFIDEEDIHLFVTRKIFNDETIEKSDDRRAVGKMINLATSYGMTEKGLADRLNIDDKEAQRFLSAYFNRFPDVDNFIRRQRALANRYEWVQTVMGRRIWINKYSRQWENNAINAPIQGSSADFTKVWVNKFRRLCLDGGLEFPVAVVVYDEVVMDVEKKNEKIYIKLLNDAFDYAAELLFPDMPFVMEIETGTSWACKSMSEDDLDDIIDEEEE